MSRCPAMHSQMVIRLLLWLPHPWILVIAGVFLIPAGPSGVEAGDGSALVARVNGSPITHAQIMRAARARLPMASYHANVSAEKRAEIERAALETLIDRDLLAQEARQRAELIAGLRARARIEVLASLPGVGSQRQGP